MRFRLRHFSLAALALLLAACASTTRVVAPDPQCEIYMDDRLVGRGEAKVDRMGTPHTAVLHAKRDGRIVGTSTMKREVTGSTVVIGLMSYYTGFWWARNYPEVVVIPYQVAYQQTRGGAAKSAWDKSPYGSDSSSVWSSPQQ